MTITTSDKTRVLTLLMIIFVTIQGAFTGIPVTDPSHPEIVLTISADVKAWITAALMFLVVIVTAWKNYLSIEIRNASNVAMIIIMAIAILGGLNDFIKAVPISKFWGAWIRFIITTLTAILNISSKTLWPTPESKQIEQMKSEMAQK